ncbi:MAG: hypothetical protein L3J34_02340 [Flavobacteriaceae bacterium]|nr:hypothetical protein [Flavobacteriaceae bacterium]
MQKHHSLSVFILLILFTSCLDKKIQLPKIESEGISDIYNHSSIWIFFEIKDGDTIAKLNKNNKIINTDWIYNIDKRLPMQKITPFLHEMQENKNKDSMHKKGGMLNYFSYADILNNKNALIYMHPTNYIYTEKAYQELLTKEGSKKIIELNIQNDQLFLDEEKIDLTKLSDSLNNIHFKDSLNNVKLIVKYNGNLSYQNYLKTKIILNNTKVKIDSTEYIYSLK